MEKTGYIIPCKQDDSHQKGGGYEDSIRLGLRSISSQISRTRPAKMQLDQHAGSAEENDAPGSRFMRNFLAGIASTLPVFKTCSPL